MIYGELVVLGHNGCISSNPSSQAKSSITSSRRKSKFQLSMKENPNGLKPSTQHNCLSSDELNKLVQKNEHHSVTYTFSRNHTVVVQYARDEKTDMFQIGRSTESSIDFIVLDTVQQQPQATTSTQLSGSKNGSNESQSTISRFACRIAVDREYPHTARIYAAGFDSSKRIFLGEKATKWKNEKGELDAVTTNGVLIMHPTNEFGSAISGKQSEWMEVSVCGAVFSLNDSRLNSCIHLNNNHLLLTKNDTQNGSNLELKNNILRDGTLIDLCGATLLWRSVDSLRKTPSRQLLEMNLQNLNKLKPQCPVGFKTLVFPPHASPSQANMNQNNNLQSKSKSIERTPMVYLKCGHVIGHHNWGIKKDNERECPLCRKIGPFVQLLIGLEPSFYCDKKQNDNDANLFKPYAFLPCGHMASEATCKYWSEIMVPQGSTQGLSSVCPFCVVHLCKEQPFSKLIFQESF